MDSAAELTLQILRRIQRHVAGDGRAFPDQWSIWPNGRRGTWAATRSLLAALPKPVFVAPLVEPGMLGVWTSRHLDDAQRPTIEDQLANQVRYFSDKLDALGISATGQIQFGPPQARGTIAVADFLRWAHEYALGVGVSLTGTPSPGAAMVIVRAPGGGVAPLDV